MSLVKLTQVIAAAIAGELVSFPTDTVPALAVRPDQAALIYQIKGRSRQKPLILMGASLTEIWDYVAGTQGERQVWQELTDRHWPGALTLVLPASDRLPEPMNPTGEKTIGIRVPNSAIAQEILKQTGPLATTSANLSGEPSLEFMTEINQVFPHIYVLDCTHEEQKQKIGSGQPSTVIQWTENDWKILRQGAIYLEKKL